MAHLGCLPGNLLSRRGAQQQARSACRVDGAVRSCTIGRQQQVVLCQAASSVTSTRLPATHLESSKRALEQLKESAVNRKSHDATINMLWASCTRHGCTFFCGFSLVGRDVLVTVAGLLLACPASFVAALS